MWFMLFNKHAFAWVVDGGLAESTPDFAELDRLLTYANIANDEMDPGQPLKLGLDLFQFASVHAFLADGPHDGAWRWGDGSALGGAGPAPTLYLTDVQVPRADVHGALIPPCCPSWYFMKPAA